MRQSASALSFEGGYFYAVHHNWRADRNFRDLGDRRPAKAGGHGRECQQRHEPDWGAALRFDALTALLDLAKGYAAHESQTLIETIKSRRSVITATSTPDDVLKQEGIISEALSRISMVAERYPELKASERYKKCMDAVDSYEKMVRTSRLIYNDSVTRLNRELRMFPTSLLGGMFGFRQRDYLEAVEEKADMPSMK